MSSKFVSKLKREIKKSPGKAGVLLVLCMVALWFWLPLAGNLFADSAKNPPAANTTTLPDMATVPGSVHAAGPQQPITNYHWKQIAEAIEHDPLMRSQPALNARDVFQAQPETPPQIVEKPPIEESTQETDIVPQAAGLVLTSTIVGPRTSVARFNGKSYRVGDTIETYYESQPVVYKVVSIEDRGVWLALGNKSYEVQMPRKGAAPKVNPTASVSSDSPDFDPSWLEQ